MEPERINPNLDMSTINPVGSNPVTPLDTAASFLQQGNGSASTSGTPVAAEDSDIIEQEWVAAVKRTLEQYKNDPYSLSRAMTELRQDYLQKRYGRAVEAAK